MCVCDCMFVCDCVCVSAVMQHVTVMMRWLPLEMVAGMSGEDDCESRGQKVNMSTWLSHDQLPHTHTHTHLMAFCMCAGFWHNRKWSEQKPWGESKSGWSIYHFPSENERFCPFVRFGNDGEDSWGNSCMRMKLCFRKGQTLMGWSHASRVVVFLAGRGGTGENPRRSEFLWAEPRLHLYETHLSDTLHSEGPEKRLWHRNTHV